MAATYNIVLNVTRTAVPGDAKGSLPTKQFAAQIQNVLDDEFQFPVAAGAVDSTLILPNVGSCQFLLMRTDQPVTYKRNAETVVNNLGTNGLKLETGVPVAGVNLTQFLFSNPGTVPATVYIIIAGQ